MSRLGSRHGRRQVFPSCGCFQGTVAVSHCACVRIPQRPWAGLQVCLRAEALGRLPAAGFHSQARPGLSRASGAGSAVSAGLPLSALAFQDLVRMVEQLARFLGVSCDKAQLEALTEHCHQLVDQCCNAEALPVGRGTRPAAPFLCPCPPPPAGVRCPPHQGSSGHLEAGPSMAPRSVLVCCMPCFPARGGLVYRRAAGVCQALWAGCFHAGAVPDGPTGQSGTGVWGCEFQSSQHAGGFLSLQLARGS